MKIFENIKSKIKNTINYYFLSLESKIIFSQKKTNLEQNILHSKELGINPNRYCDHDIIVSLTTYGKRLHEVHLSIESIMEQTMKANRIILWLDNSLKNENLPQSLYLQQQRGLEIKYCEDLRSYKKLIPTLKLCPNDAIVTIDDDLIYEFDLLEHLIKPYLSNPSFIYCHRMHKMVLDHKENLLPYIEWELNSSNPEPSHMNFPTTGGGTLFPPHSLDEEVLNEDVFMNICKYADDVWFKAMSLKKGTKPKKVYSHNSKGDEYVTIPNNQDMGLYNINIAGEALNDKQIKSVFVKYDLYKKLS